MRSAPGQLAGRAPPRLPPAARPTPRRSSPLRVAQLAAEAAAPVDPSSEFFVRIQDGEFVAGCERFLLVSGRAAACVLQRQRAGGGGARSAAAAAPPQNWHSAACRCCTGWRSTC